MLHRQVHSIATASMWLNCAGEVDMSCVLVLQVNGLAELPRDITKLGCLEYLDISYNMISHVPTALSR